MTNKWACESLEKLQDTLFCHTLVNKSLNINFKKISIEVFCGLGSNSSTIENIFGKIETFRLTQQNQSFWELF